MKKAIIITSIVGIIYLATRVKSNATALQNIKTKIGRVTKINFENGSLKVNLDLKLTNLSDYNVDLDTLGLLSLKKLRFFNALNRTLIGEANVSVSEIQLPSKKTVILPNVKVDIPLANALNHLSLFKGNAEKNIAVVVAGNVAGKDFEINPENYV